MQPHWLGPLIYTISLPNPSKKAPCFQEPRPTEACWGRSCWLLPSVSPKWVLSYPSLARNYFLKETHRMLPYQMLKLSESKYLIQSSTIPRRSYTMEKRLGVWTCSCKGFNLCCINKNTNCRHLKALFVVHPELQTIHHDPTGLRISSPFGEAIQEES